MFAATDLQGSPLAWLGRISYGVYLYHWPVFVVLDRPRVELDTWPLFVLRMATTLVLAQLSYSLFERPIRNGSPRARTVGFGALAATVVAAATIAIGVPAGVGDYWRGDSAAAAVAAAIDPVGEGTLAPLVPLVATSVAPASSVSPVPSSDGATTSPSTPPAPTPTAVCVFSS